MASVQSVDLSSRQRTNPNSATGRMLRKANNQLGVELVISVENKIERVTATRFLVNYMVRTDPADVTSIDFVDNGMKNVLDYYSGRPRIAINEAYFSGVEVDLASSFKDSAYRVLAMRSLASKTYKIPKELKRNDFLREGLGILYSDYYKRDPYGIITEAFPKLGLKEWEIGSLKSDFFTNSENRKNAVRWLVGKLDKRPEHLTLRDFRDKGLNAVVLYSKGMRRAITEAYPDLEIDWDDALKQIKDQKHLENL